MNFSVFSQNHKLQALQVINHVVESKTLLISPLILHLQPYYCLSSFSIVLSAKAAHFRNYSFL